jgi:hypothetical protein
MKSIKIFKIFKILMYTGVAAYLEFCGLRLRDTCFVAVPVGVCVRARVLVCACVCVSACARACVCLSPTVCVVSNTSCQRLDCLYRYVIKYRKAACTVFLMMDTCFRHVEDNMVELNH